MNANNGWPGKPGVPMNSERDGWHWLLANTNKGPQPEAAFWDSRCFAWFCQGIEELTRPEKMMNYGWLGYLGPCLTPDEAAALQKRVALLVSIIMRSFCYDDEEDLLRLLARSLCRIEGQDPDAIVSVDKGPFEKNWKRFLPQACAALEGKKDE